LPVGAIQQRLPRLLGLILERLPQVDPALARQLFERLLHVPRSRPRAEPAIEQWLSRIRDHFGRVEGPAVSQSMTLLARAVGAVEGKRPRLQLRNAGPALHAR